MAKVGDIVYCAGEARDLFLVADENKTSFLLQGLTGIGGWENKKKVRKVPRKDLVREHKLAKARIVGAIRLAKLLSEAVHEDPEETLSYSALANEIEKMSAAESVSGVQVFTEDDVIIVNKFELNPPRLMGISKKAKRK